MPGFCDAFGMQSTSEPSAIVGPPVPLLQRATQADGMPATPRLDREAVLLEQVAEITLRLRLLEARAR